ncbi:MAG: transcriptional regulator [Promethearchaeia archaeon]
MVDKEKVIEIFKKLDKPLKPGEIAKELGVESKEVSAVIKELRTEGKVYSPKRCYYALK